MQSATSLFNPAVGRKSVSRYWPVWGVYLAAWLLLLPSTLHIRQEYLPQDIAAHCDSVMLTFTQGVAAVMTALFAIFAAMAVWSYLMNPRAAVFYHALPVRREGLFVTQYLTGLSFLVVPACITALAAYLTEIGMGYSAGGGLVLQWLAATLMMSFFFFSLATLCAFLTGHPVALPILYVLLNFAVIVVEYLLRYACSLFLRGVEVGGPRLDALSPLVELLRYRAVLDDGQMYSGFPYLGWLVLAGVVLTVCTLLLCRRRQTESAGDVIAVHTLRPVFKYVFALGCAVVLGSIFFILINETESKLLYIFCLMAGGAIGYLAAEMMLRKRFRVLRRSWKGLCILLVAVLALSLSVACDLFGVERWVPDVSSVKSVTLNDNMFTDPDTVARVTALHRMILSNSDGEDRESGGWINLIYQMDDGRTVSRSYDLPGVQSDLADVRTPLGLCAAILNDEGAILARTLPPEGARVQYINLDISGEREQRSSVTISTQDYEAMFTAIRADAACGTLDDWSGYNQISSPVGSINMRWYYTTDTMSGYCVYDVYPDDLNLLEFLQKYGYWER